MGKNSEDRQKISSGFFVTINTNQSPTTKEEAISMARELEEATKEIFENLDNYVDGELLTYNGDDKFFGTFDESDIEDINVHTAVELGENARGGRIHSHTLIQIIHWTNIQINCEWIKQKIAEMLGLYNVYCNVKFVPGSRDSVLLYIDKNVRKQVGKEFIDESEMDSQKFN